MLGTVTRLSPLQAVVSITVVDGVPLPVGEEFTGVIRVQEVRATEKDKVKIADCFRGGDVVKGSVVSVNKYRTVSGFKYKVDLVGRCSKLLCVNGQERPRGDIRDKRSRCVARNGKMLLVCLFGGRCYNGACIMARDAMPEDRADREAQVCKARGVVIFVLYF